MGIVGILAVAALVVVPLFSEYADFRRAWGLGPLGALGLTALVVPSVAIGVVVAAYSLAVRAAEAALAPERASSR